MIRMKIRASLCWIFSHLTIVSLSIVRPLFSVSSTKVSSLLIVLTISRFSFLKVAVPIASLIIISRAVAPRIFPIVSFSIVPLIVPLILSVASLTLIISISTVWIALFLVGVLIEPLVYWILSISFTFLLNLLIKPILFLKCLFHLDFLDWWSCFLFPFL